MIIIELKVSECTDQNRNTLVNYAAALYQAKSAASSRLVLYENAWSYILFAVVKGIFW